MADQQPDCFTDDLLPLDQRLQQILAATTAVQGSELVAIDAACRRTLAVAIDAPFCLPSHDNAAVDGYGFCFAEPAATTTLTLKIIATQYAGKTATVQVKPGECVHIMTGAAIPAGVNTVVAAEQVRLDGNNASICCDFTSGQNIRRAGENIRSGQQVLPAGKFLCPADIGVLASMGLAEVAVCRRLQIAVHSSGSELQAVGEVLEGDKLYDCNSLMLAAALDRRDINLSNLGVIPDQPQELLDSFTAASKYADIIIASGGMAAGLADYTKSVLRQIGDIIFWKIAIKPGRPFVFGKIGNSLFFGLPGNPVAVMVTFYQLVLPAVEKMLAITNKPIAPKILATATCNIRKKPGRTEFIRATVSRCNDGSWQTTPTPKQGSGILLSMSQATALIILPHQLTNVTAGDTVTVQLLGGRL